MGDADVERMVLHYLRQKGFKQTERAFHEEQTKAPAPAATSHPDTLSTLYLYGYSKLRTWTDSSLDLYKHELLKVLYPVFIHSFMDLVAKGYMQEARSFFNEFRGDHDMLHMRDLRKLEGVLTPTHLKEMEFAHTLRHSKAVIKIRSVHCCF